MKRNATGTSNSASMIGRHRRTILGISLSLLSVSAFAVSLFPIERPAYFWLPFQAQFFFGSNILTFSSLYAVFVFSLLLSATQLKDNSAGKLGGFLLVSVFALVSTCFWALKLSVPTLSSYDAGGESYVSYLMASGGLVSSNPYFGYFEFPSLAVIGATLSYVTGFSVVNMGRVFIIAGQVFLSASIFLYASRALGRLNLAVIVSVLIVMGNVALFGLGYYRPDTLGIMFFIPFFVILARPDTLLGTTRAQIVLGLLFLGLVLTSFIYMIAFFLMIVAVRLSSSLTRKGVKISGMSILLMFLLMMVVRLYFYFGYQYITSSLVISRLQLLLSDPLSLLSFVSVSSYQSAYVGTSNPMWIQVTRLSWLGLTIFGFLSGVLLFAFKRKTISSFWVREAGCMFGIMALASVMIPFDNGANRTATVFLILASPFGLLSALRLGSDLIHRLGRGRRIGEYRRGISLIALLMVLALIAVPTFFVLNPTPNTDYVYPRESQTLGFVTHTYLGSPIYLDVNTAILLSNYLPNEFPNKVNYFPDPRGTFNAISLEEYFGSIVPNFMAGFLGQKSNLFIYSPRITQNALSFWGIQPQNSNWQALRSELFRTDVVYQNGFNVVYWNP